MRQAELRISSNLPDALDHHSARLEEFSIKIEQDGTAVVSVTFPDTRLAPAFEAEFAAKDRAA
jgi:hypothetical protein